jgi:heme/copper-type cytochrome/quinol oxidase subunit 2
MELTADHRPPATGDRSPSPRTGPSVTRRTKRLFLLSFAILASAILIIPWPFSPAPTTRHFTLTGSQFKYEPGTLQVNRGDTVVITLAAADVVHGLYLDSYGLDLRAEPGRSQTIQFVADKPGKFRYRCSVSCGVMHPFMIGELIVGPNITFGRAVALTVLVAVGALVYLSRFPSRQPGEIAA